MLLAGPTCPKPFCGNGPPRRAHCHVRCAAKAPSGLAVSTASTPPKEPDAAPEAAVPPSPSTSAAEPAYPGPLEATRPPKIAWEDIILFQGFGWESCKTNRSWWKTVESKIAEIQESGSTHLWLPPPSASVAPQGYLPSQLYDLNSAYGDYSALVSLNSAALKAGIRPVADIVINHRCADEKDSNGVWNHFRDDVPHPGRRINWGPWAITGNDPDFGGTGSHDTGDDFGPSPDLDHSNKEVRDGLVDWLHWMREYVGFEGWRIDFAKGFSPDITREYVERTLEAGVDFCVAEYWVDAKWNGSDLDYNQDGMRQGLCDWMNAAKYSAGFDFPTKAILQEAVRHCQYDRLRDREGKPPGLIGWWPRRAVTFIDNHDTGSTQQHWPFPADGVLQGYAYILTHPGIPTIFWEHWFEGGLAAQLKALVQLRKRAGIKANSAVEILAAEGDLYVAKVGGTVVLKLGPRFDMGPLLPDAAQGWEIAGSGKDWAVWELSAAKPASS